MEYRNISEKIQKAALKSVDPEYAVSSFLEHHPNLMRTQTTIDVVAIGKAAVPMMQAIANQKAYTIQRALVITKTGHTFGMKSTETLHICESEHPVPGNGSLQSGTILFNFLKLSTAQTILFLISGGGSSLITFPYEGISLEDVQQTTQALLACGATIQEINALRKHIDAVKGGGLLAAIPEKTFVRSLVLSDVIGDDFSVIASGPTYWDNSTFHSAMQLLHTYEIVQSVPVSVREHLQRGINGEVPETLKMNNPRFRKVRHYLVGNLSVAIEAASTEVKKLGYKPVVLTYEQQGEARHVGIEFANTVLNLSKKPHPPLCVIMGGETTVTLNSEKNGTGGRNQELILSAGIELAEQADVYLASFGTDGIDGPTDAAGACWDRIIVTNVKDKGLHPIDYLHAHDSYSFFQKTGGLIKSGPTGTNVGDITFALVP